MGRAVDEIAHSPWAVRDRGTVVHEALHLYLQNINSPLMGDDNEAWVGEREAICKR